MTALMVVLLYGVALGQGATRVMSGYAAISGPHAVLWVARDAGLFEKNGLRAEVAYIRSGSTMAQALGAGEIQLVTLNTTPIITMGNVSNIDVIQPSSRAYRQSPRLAGR